MLYHMHVVSLNSQNAGVTSYTYVIYAFKSEIDFWSLYQIMH